MLDYCGVTPPGAFVARASSVARGTVGHTSRWIGPVMQRIAANGLGIRASGWHSLFTVDCAQSVERVDESFGARCLRR